ncbi:MAG: hypothetical protein WBD46_12355 [Acidobacteriaceae bacterium]
MLVEPAHRMQRRGRSWSIVFRLLNGFEIGCKRGCIASKTRVNGSSNCLGARAQRFRGNAALLC